MKKFFIILWSVLTLSLIWNDVSATPEKPYKDEFSGVVAITGATKVLLESPDWYIRGAVGGVKGKDSDFSDNDCHSVSPPALFGCGTGSDGKSLGAYGDFGKYLSMEIAGGKYVLPWLRTDMALTYRPNMKYSGSANFIGVSGPQPVSTTARSLSLMGNVFFEPAPLLGLSQGHWHPYLGVGLGASYNRLKKVTYRFPEASVHHISITPSGERFDPAFMVSVGMGIVMSQKWMIDISLRYEDLGDVNTDQGGMYMNHVSEALKIAKTEADVRGFGVFLSARYFLF